MQNDLTTQHVFKTILRFSPPFFLSYFLQTLYGMADLFIIGRFDSVAATTAVSIGSQAMHLITVMLVGLSMGSTIKIGTAVGAKDYKDASTTVGNTFTIFMMLSVLLMGALVFLVSPIVNLMSTPEEAVRGTAVYLTISFIGIPFITLYNVVSSVFRGLGDSKSPMYFVAISCTINIALDYIFIGSLGLGPAGAALATVISQSASAAIAIVVILRRKSGIRLTREHLIPKMQTVRALFGVGLPIAVQDGFIQVSFIVITVIVNQRGLADAAAVGIVEKIIGFLFLVPSSMLATISALGAQNIGAGKPERTRQLLRYGILICVGFGSVFIGLMEWNAEFFIHLFKDDIDVVRLGGQYMRGYVLDCIMAGIHFCFSGYFCAHERSLYSFIHNIISIVCVRIPLAYLASTHFPDTLFPMGIATTLGSVASIVICLFLYARMCRLTGRSAPS